MIQPFCAYFVFLIRRSGEISIEPYDDSPAKTALTLSTLYNSMIFPFMRTVIYGVIWYQGESNANINADKYACSFAKMIQYWRQIWNERTNNITDIQFPFGFVQVSFVLNIIKNSHSKLIVSNTCK